MGFRDSNFYIPRVDGVPKTEAITAFVFAAGPSVSSGM